MDPNPDPGGPKHVDPDPDLHLHLHLQHCYTSIYIYLAIFSLSLSIRFRLEGQSREDDVKSRESMELLLTSLPCISLCYSTSQGELVGQLRHGELANTDENMNVEVPADKQSQGSAPANQNHVGVNSIQPGVGKPEGAAAGVREGGSGDQQIRNQMHEGPGGTQLAVSHPSSPPPSLREDQKVENESMQGGGQLFSPSKPAGPGVTEGGDGDLPVPKTSLSPKTSFILSPETSLSPKTSLILSPETSLSPKTSLFPVPPAQPLQQAGSSQFSFRVGDKVVAYWQQELKWRHGVVIEVYKVRNFFFFYHLPITVEFITVYLIFIYILF